MAKYDPQEIKFFEYRYGNAGMMTLQRLPRETYGGLFTRYRNYSQPNRSTQDIKNYLFYERGQQVDESMPISNDVHVVIAIFSAGNDTYTLPLMVINGKAHHRYYLDIPFNINATVDSTIKLLSSFYGFPYLNTELYYMGNTIGRERKISSFEKEYIGNLDVFSNPLPQMFMKESERSNHPGNTYEIMDDIPKSIFIFSHNPFMGEIKVYDQNKIKMLRFNVSKIDFYNPKHLIQDLGYREGDVQLLIENGRESITMKGYDEGLILKLRDYSKVKIVHLR